MNHDEKNKIEGEQLLKKGLESFNNGYYNEAVEYLEEASSILDDKFTYYHLGKSYVKLNEYKKALNAYDTALNKLDPNNPSKEHCILYQEKARLEMTEGNVDKANEYFEEVINIGKKFMSKTDLKKCIQDIDAEKNNLKKDSVNLGRRKYEEMLKQADALKEKESYKEAAVLYTKCLGMVEDSEIKYKRAECYRLMKKYKDAIEEYNRCIASKRAINKNEIKLYENCLHFQAKCYLEICSYTNAIEILKKLHEKLISHDRVKNDKYIHDTQELLKFAYERLEVYLLPYIVT